MKSERGYKPAFERWCIWLAVGKYVVEHYGLSGNQMQRFTFTIIKAAKPYSG